MRCKDMIQYRSLFFILALICSLTANARIVYLSGKVIDVTTLQDLPNAEVAVLSPNDSVVSIHKALRRSQVDGVIFKTSEFRIPFNYSDSLTDNLLCLKVSYPGFDTLVVDRAIHIGRRETQLEIGNIALTRTPKQLQEVTVTASKVKFYHKGDTLVYNADAFMLAEGSMLDALIAQLPGVELKSDGQIFVNGKRVDNLLLNGKEFFNSDRRLLLDNLGAYTVKNINVYNKWGKDSEFVGRKIGNDSEYVMDVRLKREYSRGTVLNVEAGGGTSSRWMGRAFAMHFGSRDRYTFYANANNLNDNRKPGRSDSWRRGSLMDGEKKQEKTGMDYSIEAPNKTWEINGNIEGSHENGVLIKDLYQTTFLPTSNTFERSINASRNKTWSINTGHNFYTKWKLVNLRVKPAFSYSSGKRLGEISMSSAFDEAFANLINSSKWNIRNRTHNLKASIDLTSIVRFKSMPDFMELTANALYSSEWSERYQDYAIDYVSLGTSQQQHQLYKNYPNNNFSANFGAKYDYKWSNNISSSLKYNLNYQHNLNTSNLYLIERIADATGNETLKDWYTETEVPDISNSYRSTRNEFGHCIMPSLLMNTPNLWIQFNMPVELRTQRLKYVRGDNEYHISRTSPVLKIYDTFMDWKNVSQTLKVKFEFNLNTSLPSLTSMVDIIDDTNPLDIFEGNPDVKNAYDMQSRLCIDFGPKLMHEFEITAGGISNALVNSYIFDTHTGVRHYKTCNVSGDWNVGGYLINDFEFGRTKCMDLRVNTGATFHNAVDMIGENSSLLTKSNIRNLHLMETVSYDWRFSKHKIGTKISGTWRHSSSPDNRDYNSFNATDLSYGITGLFKLPANFEVSSDIGANSRFGYNSNLVNRTEILWNARVSCTLDKGRWVISLDGFDLLNQCRNVTYNVNAQGRTEVRTNTLPRYAMLHVQYRLNILPKKHK